MIQILTGDNWFAVLEKSQDIIDKFVADYDDLAVEKIDCEDAGYDKIQAATESVSFLNPRKLVVLRSPSLNKDILEKYDKLLNSVADTTDLLIIERRLDKRTGYYKYIKKLTGYNELSELNDAQTSNWLIAKAEKLGAKISRSDAVYLQDRVGHDQALLSNELEKLISYDPNISKASIDLLSDPTPNSTVFSLLEASFTGQKNKASQIYSQQRSLKIEPQQIIAMIAWQLHILAIVKTASDYDDMTIAKDTKISPYVVKKTRLLANKFTISDIKHLVKSILKIDNDTKTKPIDADVALRLWIMTVVQ